MAGVFVAGPLSGLIMQPLIGKQPVQIFVSYLRWRFIVVQALWPTILPHVLGVGDRTCCWVHSCACSPCYCWASLDLSRHCLRVCILRQYVTNLSPSVIHDQSLLIYLERYPNHFPCRSIDLPIGLFYQCRWKTSISLDQGTHNNRTVHAVDRALIVDTLPPSRQAPGNAWAATMLGIGSVVGFFMFVSPLIAFIHHFHVWLVVKLISLISSHFWATLNSRSCLSSLHS